MIELSGVHLLLTYQCTLECDHCFVWGSPWQSGTISGTNVQKILDQSRDMRTIRWIYFEGGEPFLYYSLLLQSVRAASSMGFKVGIVSNSFWATTIDDAVECLRPFAGLVDDLSISSDIYHWDAALSQQAQNAQAAAQQLDIPLGIISIAQPESADTESAVGQLPAGEGSVMYRGRAAAELADRVPHHPWDQFDTCPFEDLRDPGRVHIDPFGNVHICQGISIGNVFEQSLAGICAAYDPDAHPITGPILAGGPAELTRRYDLPHQAAYADACHLCSQSCAALRSRYPSILTPDQMFGVTWA